MTTSGSINFSVSRDDIITEALELMGVLGEGESPNTDQLSSMSRTLNMLVKNWQAEGLNLFAVKRQYLFPSIGQKEYSMVSTTTDHITEEFFETSLSSVSLAASDQIEVEDFSNITQGDYIGIAQGNKVQWTTVLDPVLSNVIVLSDVLVSDVTEGSAVFSYTTKATRPMKIMEGYYYLHCSKTDIPVGNISRRKYNSLSVKDSKGFINQFYYDPQVPAGNLFVWPTALDEKDHLTLFVQRTLEDMDEGTDSPDYPQEWYMPLAYNLAMHSSPKYGIPQQDYSIIERQAVMLYQRAEGFDEELYTSVFMTPDTRGEDL
jgi:hypothetical protein